MHTEFQIFWKIKMLNCVFYDQDILFEFQTELFDITFVINTLIKLPGKFRGNGVGFNTKIGQCFEYKKKEFNR